MDRKQKIAIILSPTITVVMFFVYQGFAIILGKSLGWYVGFAIYWPFFCVIIPVLLIPKELMTFPAIPSCGGTGAQTTKPGE